MMKRSTLKQKKVDGTAGQYEVIARPGGGVLWVGAASTAQREHSDAGEQREGRTNRRLKRDFLRRPQSDKKKTPERTGFAMLGTNDDSKKLNTEANFSLGGQQKGKIILEGKGYSDGAEGEGGRNKRLKQGNDKFVLEEKSYSRLRQDLWQDHIRTISDL